MALAGLIIAVLALIVSIGAVGYTRKLTANDTERLGVERVARASADLEVRIEVEYRTSTPDYRLVLTNRGLADAQALRVEELVDPGGAVAVQGRYLVAGPAQSLGVGQSTVYRLEINEQAKPDVWVRVSWTDGRGPHAIDREFSARAYG